jgi:hypothetical protein
LLAKIDNQLAKAVRDLSGVSHDDLDSITRQKLILDATDGLSVRDLVTTQCYLHGEVAVKGKENNRVGSSTLGTAGVTKSRIPTKDQVYDYFTEEREEYVENALEQDTLDWLEEYYQKGDIHFRDVYLAGFPIYRVLSRVREASLERNPEILPEGTEDTVRSNTSDLKQALLRYPGFKDIPPYVTEFNEAVCPLLRWIDEGQWQKESDDISELYHLFDSLHELFYRGTWQASAQIMSYQTVSGPSAEKTRDRRKRELQMQHTTFREKLYRLQNDTESFDVSVTCDAERLPELKPYEMNEEEILEPSAVESISDEDPAFELFE